LRPLPVRRLVAGQLYSRRHELHPSGLGADIFKGISYGRGGDHVLLFSVGHGADFGYDDGWHGNVFRYYGEWRGEGDMTLSAGNVAIRDRSPNIYLFTASEHRTWYRFEGRFKYLGHTFERTVSQNHAGMAIVFELQLVAREVEL
jgi:hypothetical protein